MKNVKITRNEMVATYVASLGGEVGAQFVRLTGEDGDHFTIEDRNSRAVHIAEDGTEYSSLSALLAYLDREYPLPLTASGSNTEGGNAANNRIGNYDIYGHTFLDSGITYGEILGKELPNTIVRLGRSFKAYLKLSDQKLLESSADTHASKAWGKLIFHYLAEIYGANTAVTARKSLTVEEFGLRFGLPMPAGIKRDRTEKEKVKRFRRGAGSY